MTILELQYDADAKRLYLKLTRNSFCIFFPVNDIVSYREFISSPLHVRLKQLCPTHGPVEGFVRPILSFSCSDKLSYILTTTSYFDNLQFAIFDVDSSEYHFNQDITRAERGAQFLGGPVTMGRRMTTGSPKSHNNVTSTFFNTLHLLPKYLRFERGGGKLASCPRRHLTSLYPWL